MTDRMIGRGAYVACDYCLCPKRPRASSTPGYTLSLISLIAGVVTVSSSVESLTLAPPGPSMAPL
ncbi:MAG: hypothetical protein AAGA62_13710, partial [Bacteroidota bacterium]